MADTSADQSPDVFQIASRPGIRRDGTNFDSGGTYSDGQWVRFQRGRPRKIGGYRAISDMLSGPMRASIIDSRATGNTAHVFSPFGVQQLVFDNNGVGAGITDRTPVGFPVNQNYTWQAASMFDSSGGGTPALVCAATPDVLSIADDTAGGVYTGNITALAPLVAVADGVGPITVSGGCVVLQPFLFVYGSNGLIRNSNANVFQGAAGWVGTNANTANVSGTKIVKGLAVRGGGNSPSGLFWALDSLIRVSFVGGTALWKYDVVSDSTTVLSKSSILEYDGVYFWIGIDRFFTYSGVVQELPNNMNQNFFFDNLNFAQRQKVWALAVPRFGEIWWFYPTGTNTECDHAIIFNVRENTWYDTAISRTCGSPAQVFPKPVMGGDPTSTTYVTFTAGAGAFAPGMVVTGGTSGAFGTVRRVLPGQLNLINGSGTFSNGETISSGGNTGTTTAASSLQDLCILWQHETGTDKVYNQDVTAILSYFETDSIQWMTGGPASTDAPQGANLQTRLVRYEPDFVASNSLTLNVRGRNYAQGTDYISTDYTFDGTTEFMDLDEQRRELIIRITSNVAGGNYEMGRCLGTVTPGDVRG